MRESANYGWDKLYHTTFDYTSLNVIPGAEVYSNYRMVFILMDDDMGFPDQLMDNRPVCLDHYYQNWRPVIQHHIPVKRFPGRHEGINWAS